ncbi:MAG: leucine-rich repeat protein [Lachnospiraceae bacterium]|nr:leucine-rich repeat protein [Lachnospiraceae bacterium]
MAGSGKTVQIPDGTVSIGPSVFRNNQQIEKVVMPDSVRFMSSTVFEGCRNLYSVRLSKNLEHIATGVFQNCVKLQEINLEETKAAVLGEAVFAGCTRLTHIKLPDTCLSIGVKAFSGCSHLSRLELNEGLEYIGDSAIHGGNRQQGGYTPLHTLELPSTLKYVGNLEGCIDVRRVIYPEGLTELPEYAFSRFDALSELKLPESLKKIGKGFLFVERNLGETTSLTSLYIPAGVERIDAEMPVELKTIRGIRGSYAEEFANDNGIAFQATTAAAEAARFAETKSSPSENKSYTQISSAEQLLNIEGNMSGNYRLTADIDLSAFCEGENGWRPLGTDGTTGKTNVGFSGIFDGNGHTISGLKISGAPKTRMTGLFGQLDGTVRNLSLKDVSVRPDYSEVTSKTEKQLQSLGALAGAAGVAGKASVENCSVSGTVALRTGEAISTDYKNTYVGGLVGYLSEGVMKNCRNEAAVYYQSMKMEDPDFALHRFLGGICGMAESSSLSDCVNTASVGLYRNFEGIFQENDSNANFLDNLENTYLKSSAYDVWNGAGGITGIAIGEGTISRCYNTAEIVSDVYNKYDAATLNAWTGTYAAAGGIAGMLNGAMEVADCYNRADISGKCHMDGSFYFLEGIDKIFDQVIELAAQMGTVLQKSQSYVYDDIPNNGKGYTGGIVGFAYGTTGGPVTRCYSIGQMEGKQEKIPGEKSADESRKKGICGGGKIPVLYSYYVRPAGSSDSYSGAAWESDSSTTTTALTADAMKQASSFEGFDFDGTWYLADGMDAPGLVANSGKKIADIRFSVNKPTKTTYVFGEEISLSGMEVTISFSDGTKAVTGISDTAASGYSARQPGVQTVTVNYGDISTSFSVTVSPEAADASSDGETAVSIPDSKPKGTYQLGENELSVPTYYKQEKDYTVEYSLLEFGSYPQTKVNAGDDAYRTLSGGQTSWDAANDTTIGENKYRRVYDETTGAYSYYKYEPIRWRLLNFTHGRDYAGKDIQNVGVLIADRVLDYRRFGTSRYVGKGDQDHYLWNTSSWEQPTALCSELYSWLNGKGAGWNTNLTDFTDHGFLQQAFTESEISGLFPIKDYDDGNKRVTATSFVISAKDVLGTYPYSCFRKEAYIKDQNRQAKATDYTAALLAQSENASPVEGGYCAWGALPYFDSSKIAHGDSMVSVVGADGTVDRIGHTASAPIGIRPMIQVKFDDSVIADSVKYVGVVDSTGKVSEGKGHSESEAKASASPAASSSPEPGESAQPSASAEPGGSAQPSASIKPGESARPGESAQPGTSAKPDASAEPGESAQPGTSAKPDTSAQPGTSAKPDASAQPDASTQPGASAKPAVSPKPTAAPSASSKKNHAAKINLKNKKTYSVSKKVTIKDADGIKTIQINKKTIKGKGKKSFSFKLSKYKKYLKQAGKWNKLIITDKKSKKTTIKFKVKKKK